MPRSFDSVFYGAAGTSTGGPVDDEFNRVSFLSHFDGANNGVNNVFDDGSASNHTITANGNVTQGSFGPFARPDGEWGVAFDGDDYLNVNDGVTFGSGDFTIEMFANFSSVAANSILFDGRPTSTAGDYPIIIHDSAAGGLDYHVGGTVISGGTIVANTWYHIAVCRSSSSTKMFLDGTQIGSTYSDSKTYVDSGRMRLGASGSSATNILQGSLSNVRVVNSALYTSNFTAPTSPLTAVTNTKLLTCQSNRFVDNSASPLTVSLVGNPSVSAFGPFLTSEVYDPAVNGASAYFDGNGDYLKNTNNNTDLQFGTGDLTVEFWLYLKQIGVVQYPFDTRQSPNGDGGGIQVAILANNTMWVDMDGAGITLQTSLTLKANEWTHVALTRASGTWRFFFNGVLNSGTGSDSGNITGGYLSIGTSATRNTADGDDKIYGYMSDVRAVKGTAVYTSAFTPPTAPLTAITNTTLLLNMADGQAIDSAAQHNLTLADDVKLSTAKAKFGDTSMLFDGSGKAYIEGSNIVNFGSGDFTVEFFMNSTTGGGEEVLLDARNSNDGSGPMFTLETDTSDKIVYRVNAGNRIISGSAISTDTWYHIAVCRSGTSTKLFIDGTQSGSTYSDSTVYTQPNDRFILGGYYNNATYDFDGYIDELRISKMARYTSNFTAPSEPFPDKGE